MYKIARDKLIFMMFLIGMSLSLFVVLNSYQLINQWIAKYESKEEIAKYKTFVNVYSTKGMDEGILYDLEEYNSYMEEHEESLNKIMNSLNDAKCNSIIRDEYIPIGNINEEYSEYDLVLSYNGTWYWDLCEGRYPTLEEWNSNEIYVALGKSWKSQVKQNSDGQDVIIVGERNCIVTGYFDALGEDEDTSVLLFYSPAARNIKDNISQNIVDNMIPIHTGHPAFTIELLDNGTPVTETADKLVSEFSTSDAYYGELSSRYESSTDIYLFYKFKSVILVLLYAVGLVNCIMIARVWYARQKNDIVVMKTMGVTDGRILWWQLAKMMLIMAIAFVITFLINGIYNYLIGNRLMIEMNRYSVFYLLISVGLMLMFMLVPLCRLLARLVPAQDLRR